MENKAKKFLMKAMKENFAIPAVNFIDLDTLKAYLEVAKKTQLPIIIAFAEKHLEYLGFDEVVNLTQFYLAKYKVNAVLHLDHGESLGLIKKAVDIGFDSVMIDASSKSFNENVNLTKEIVEYAHSKNVFVEAEIGHVGSGDVIGVSCSKKDETVYTTKEEAKKFVELTGVDSLAISIGTSHGQYKGNPKINFDRLHEIRKELYIPLVLHGGSSSGNNNLHRCATEGINKINIYTDFLLVAQNVTNKEVNYYENKMNIRKAIENKLIEYYKVFNTKEV